MKTRDLIKTYPEVDAVRWLRAYGYGSREGKVVASSWCRWVGTREVTEDVKHPGCQSGCRCIESTTQ